MSEELPAMIAARNSWAAVQAKDKERWLSLMADDICFEDPIGVAPPTNPDGKGVHGKAALAKFWETNMAPATIRIETHESFAAGNESAHRLTLTTSFENGMTMIVNGIFTYRVNEDAKLTNLRGYWSLAESQIEQKA
jgi:steroid delta-isomerase